jgi:hypothetical protein
VFPRHSLLEQRPEKGQYRDLQKEATDLAARIQQDAFTQDQNVKHFVNFVSNQENTGLTLLRKYLANA